MRSMDCFGFQVSLDALSMAVWSMLVFNRGGCVPVAEYLAWGGISGCVSFSKNSLSYVLRDIVVENN